MEPVLDILRALRGVMNWFSTLTVAGIHLDWLAHLLGAAGIVLLLSRRWDPGRAVRWTAGLIAAKELFDVLAKTRLEYIRPPTLDLASDVASGVAGLAIGVAVARRLGWPPERRRRRRHPRRRRHHRSLFERCLPCRAGALLLAALLLLTLGLGVLAPASAGARTVLAATGLVLLVGFAWPRGRALLPWLLPLGPVLDWPLLTPGRGIYTVELVAGTAVVWWLASLATGRRRPVPAPDTPLVLWSAFGVVAVLALVAGHPDLLATFAGWRAIRSLLLAVLVAWFLRDLLWTRYPADQERLLGGWTVAWSLAVLLLAGGGLAEAVATRLRDEPGSFYRGSVGLAVHLAWSLPLVLLAALEDPDRRRRRLATAAAAAGLLCLPLTASRGAMGSVLVTGLAVLAWAWRHGDRRRRLLLGGGTAVAASVFALLALHPELAGESFAYKWHATLAGDLVSTRTAAWQEARAAIQARPFTGEGPAAWAPAIPLELARRHGLPAMLLAVAALLTAAGGALQRSRRPLHHVTARPPTRGEELARLVTAGAGLGLLGLLLVGLAETGLGARSLPLVAMALALADADLAVRAAIRRERRRSAPAGQHPPKAADAGKVGARQTPDLV